jgi:hypothetical protein
LPRNNHPGLFKKGAKNPGSRAQRAKTGAGRRKGVKNKFSRDIKEAILNALEILGGDKWFVSLGRSARTKPSMASLIRALIPLQIQGGLGPESVEERAAKVREKMASIEESTAPKEPGKK